MKIWLVWTGEYSGASVVGVYSTYALATAAAALYRDGWIDAEDGYDIDSDALMVKAGIGRWRIGITLDDGVVPWPACSISAGTGAVPSVIREDIFLQSTYQWVPGIWIECDARDERHALKIAGDERAQYLASQPIPNSAAVTSR